MKKVFAITFQKIEGPDSSYISEAYSDPGGTLDKFFSAVLGFLTIIGGIMFLIYFVIGALSWISSRGDREQVAKAQRYLTNALVGLIVMVLAWAITGILGNIFGFSIINIQEMLGTLPSGSGGS